MENWTSAVGLLAAAATSLSQIPQVIKALPRGATDDLSLKAFGILFAGLSLWVVYGVGRGDIIVAVANGIGAVLVGTILACKIRDIYASPRRR